jgi:hypothetical protein
LGIIVTYKIHEYYLRVSPPAEMRGISGIASVYDVVKKSIQSI